MDQAKIISPKENSRAVLSIDNAQLANGKIFLDSFPGDVFKLALLLSKEVIKLLFATVLIFHFSYPEEIHSSTRESEEKLRQIDDVISLQEVQPLYDGLGEGEAGNDITSL